MLVIIFFSVFEMGEIIVNIYERVRSMKKVENHRSIGTESLIVHGIRY